MKNIGIIGFGEIGKALYNVYSKYNFEPSVLDPMLGKHDEMKDCDLLNICIPYTNNFTEIVNDYISKINPKLTVIHSTVAPGTTKSIIGNVCHSPVRGLHPNLESGILTFLKFIGSENSNNALTYQKHLETLNIKSYICENSLTSEYAKLLDTTYYGLCIAFHNDVNKLCKQEGVNFDEVMTIYNQSYNDGYSALDKKNVIRPVLYASEKIGGHCVIPNVEILLKYLNSGLITEILKYK